MDCITLRHFGLMCHACGIGERTPFYRNHFAATPGDDYDLLWGYLVKNRLADLIQKRCYMNAYNIYKVTEKGKELISEVTGIRRKAKR